MLNHKSDINLERIREGSFLIFLVIELDKVTPTENSDGGRRLEMMGSESVVMGSQYLWLILLPINFLLHKQMRNRVTTSTGRGQRRKRIMRY
jgi:hypothetical protein